MIKLYCKKCNYHFEKDKVPKLCPYCSEEGSIRQTKTAQEFIDEQV